MKLQELLFQHLTFILSIYISYFVCFKKFEDLCFLVTDHRSSSLVLLFFFLNICGFLENISVLISFLTLAYLSYLRGKKILELVKNIIIFKSYSVHIIILRIKLLSNRILLCLLSVIFSTGWLENPQ